MTLDGLAYDNTPASSYAAAGDIPFDNNNWAIATLYTVGSNIFTDALYRRVVAWDNGGPAIWSGGGLDQWGIVHAGTIDLATNHRLPNDTRTTAVISRIGANAWVVEDAAVVASSTSFSVSYTTSGNTFRIGAGNTASEFGPVKFTYVYCWNARGLTPTDAMWLKAEPYVVFRPSIRRRYSVPAGGTMFPQSVADTVALSETVTKQAQKTLPESLGLTETLTPQTRKAILETIAATEALVRQLARPIGETVGLTEDLGAVKVAVKALAETVTLTENLQRVLQKASDLGETVGLTETVNRLMTRVVAETVGLTEAQQREARKSLAELAGFTEQLVTTVIHAHEMAEDVTLTEAQQRQIGKAIQETLGLTETRFVQIARTVTETVNLAEALQALLIPSGGFVQIVRFTQEAFAMPEVRAETFRIGA